MSYYYNLMPNHQNNYATQLDMSSKNNNLNLKSQFIQPPPPVSYHYQQAQPISQHQQPTTFYDYTIANDFIPNLKRERFTSDSLLSLSSQIDFSNIENRSSYKNTKSTSYSYNPITNKQSNSSIKHSRSRSSSYSKRRSSSGDLNKINHDDTYHEINSNNRTILLPDLWTDGIKKRTPEKIHDFFNGKLLNKTNNNNTSNSSLNLIEMKKEFKIKKMWRKVFS